MIAFVGMQREGQRLFIKASDCSDDGKASLKGSAFRLRFIVNVGQSGAFKVG